MAYGLIMAAVEEKELNDYLVELTSITSKDKTLEEGDIPYLHAKKKILTTHYFVTGGTEYPALNEVIGELLDGGGLLHPHFWHPLRPPRVQSPEEVKDVIDRFLVTWKETQKLIEPQDLVHWKGDFDPIINLLLFIKSNNLALLTFLEKPADGEEAKKIYYPVYIEEGFLY